MAVQTERKKSHVLRILLEILSNQINKTLVPGLEICLSQKYHKNGLASRFLAKTHFAKKKRNSKIQVKSDEEHER